MENFIFVQYVVCGSVIVVGSWIFNFVSFGFP